MNYCIYLHSPTLSVKKSPQRKRKSKQKLVFARIRSIMYGICFICFTLMYFFLKPNTGYCCMCKFPKVPLKPSHPHLLNSFYFSMHGCFLLLTRSFFFHFHFSFLRNFCLNIRLFSQRNGQKANSSVVAV